MKGVIHIGTRPLDGSSREADRWLGWSIRAVRRPCNSPASLTLPRKGGGKFSLP